MYGFQKSVCVMTVIPVLDLDAPSMGFVCGRH